MQYTWLIWTLIFLLLWLIIFIFKKPFRKEMLKMSLWTMPFGLTEPLFYPEYWHPPTLFKLAEHTGFDIESLIFSFAIGGVASLLYKIVYKMENKFIQPTERNLQKHKLHFYSLLTPGIVFLLLALLTNLNHIYCGIVYGRCVCVFLPPRSENKNMGKWYPFSISLFYLFQITDCCISGICSCCLEFYKYL
jgi:dolichol kinase